MELEDLKRDAKDILIEVSFCIGGSYCYMCNKRMIPECAASIKRKLRALNEAIQEYQRPPVKVKAGKRGKAVRDAMERL